MSFLVWFIMEEYPTTIKKFQASKILDTTQKIFSALFWKNRSNAHN